jgi:hypothetical protein
MISATSTSKIDGVTDDNDDTLLLEDQLKQRALTAETEGQRLYKEADDVIIKCKRLREEADRLEQETKRLRSNAGDAYRLSRSLKFEALCHALRRNDPSIPTLDSDRLPNGYAQQLGRALKGNTFVSSMDLCIEQSFDDNSNTKEQIDASVNPLVQYIEESESLKRVNIRRPNFLSEQHESDKIVAELFLGASLRNPKIETLIFDWGMIPARSFPTDALPTSLQSLVLSSDANDFYQYPDEDQQMIGQAFRYFTSLRTLKLTPPILSW